MEWRSLWQPNSTHHRVSNVPVYTLAHQSTASLPLRATSVWELYYKLMIQKHQFCEHSFTTIVNKVKPQDAWFAVVLVSYRSPTSLLLLIHLEIHSATQCTTYKLKWHDQLLGSNLGAEWPTCCTAGGVCSSGRITQQDHILSAIRRVRCSASKTSVLLRMLNKK